MGIRSEKMYLSSGFSSSTKQEWHQGEANLKTTNYLLCHLSMADRSTRRRIVKYISWDCSFLFFIFHIYLFLPPIASLTFSSLSRENISATRMYSTNVHGYTYTFFKTTSACHVKPGLPHSHPYILFWKHIVYLTFEFAYGAPRWNIIFRKQIPRSIASTIGNCCPLTFTSYRVLSTSAEKYSAVHHWFNR